MENELKENILNSALEITVNEVINKCVKNSINSISMQGLVNLVKGALKTFRENFEFQCQSNNLSNDLNLDEKLISGLAAELSSIYVRFNYTNQLTEGMGVDFLDNSEIYYQNISSKFVDSYKKIYFIISLYNNVEKLESEILLNDELNAWLSLKASNLLANAKFSEIQNVDAFSKKFLDVYQGVYKNMTLRNNIDKGNYDILNIKDEAIDVIASSAFDVYVSKKSNKFDYDTVKANIYDSIKKIIEQKRRVSRDGEGLPSDVLGDFKTVTNDYGTVKKIKDHKNMEVKFEDNRELPIVFLDDNRIISNDFDFIRKIIEQERRMQNEYEYALPSDVLDNFESTKRSR